MTIKKLRTWKFKKAWKLPGALSFERLKEDEDDAKSLAGHNAGEIVPVSVVVTELAVRAKKPKAQ